MQTNEKKLSDAQILMNVIEALGVNKNQLAKKMKFKSHASVYHVINGQNSLAIEFKHRLITAYPQVNYNYLETGEGDILLKKDSLINQSNLFNIEVDDKEEDSALDHLLLTVSHKLEILVYEQKKTNELLAKLIEKGI